MRELSVFQLKLLRERIAKERREREDEPTTRMVVIPMDAYKIGEGCYRTPIHRVP